MHYILDNWSFDPFVIIVAAVVVWHEIGLWRLARRSRPERTRERRIRSLWFYSGLAVLLIAVDSPIDYWSSSYFIVHMVQHLLLMFAAPSLVVAGAPGQPLLDALPGRSGQAVTRSVLAGDWSRPVRAVFRFLTGPIVAVVIFNAVMVGWHIPALFDLAENNQAVHIWLMHGSFFAAGVLFWLQFIPSPPFRSRMPPLGRIAALLGTNIVMIMIAMALSIFATHSVYAAYDARARRHPARLRRPADRRGHPVGLRRLLGDAHDDRHDQEADRGRGRHRHRARAVRRQRQQGRRPPRLDLLGAAQVPPAPLSPAASPGTRWRQSIRNPWRNRPYRGRNAMDLFDLGSPARY